MFRSKQDVSKRQRSPSLDRATDRSVVKKQCEDTHPDRWVPSERFWDTLPRIYLTRRALAEHDRRNRQQDQQIHTSKDTTPPPRQSARLQKLARQKQLPPLWRAGVGRLDLDLRCFARGGGPDLTSIRGCPDPTMSNRTSQSSTPLTSSGLTASSKRSGPYDANYQLKLAQAGVFLTKEMDENGNFVMPANHENIMTRLNEARPSLSPSRFTEEDFQKFQQQTEQALLEFETMQQSMATIEGSGSGGQILSRMGGPFNNLEPFHPDIAMAVPDSYDGAPPLSIDHRVLNDRGLYITPNTDTSRPAAPNFFLEGKSKKGRADVAQRQAAHTGAIGARGMMSLQSYPSGIPQYDGNAYSFTNTYHDGQLRMYTTHATAPETEDDRPQYHMTPLGGYSMIGDHETFIRGATRYRNARDLAKEQRDSFIQQANQAARQTLAGKRDESSRTTTNTGASMRTDSRSREQRYSSDTDTSADELAFDDSFKRSRTIPSIDNESPPSPPPAPPPEPHRRQTNAGRVKLAPAHKSRKGRSKKTSR